MKHVTIFENFDTEEEKVLRVTEVMRDNFINYVLDFYGPEGAWDEFFDGKLTKDVILKYIDKFIRTRTRLSMWGRGDSFDREMFRDVLLIKLGITYDTVLDVSQYITAEERRKVELVKNKNQYNL